MDGLDKLKECMSTYSYTKSESEEDYDFFMNDQHWNCGLKEKRIQAGRPALVIPIIKPKIFTTVTALSKDKPSITSDNQLLAEFIEHVESVSNSPKLYSDVLESMIVKGEGYLFIGSDSKGLKLRNVSSELVYFDKHNYNYEEAEYCFVLQPYHKQKFKGKDVNTYDGKYLVEYYFKDTLETKQYVLLDGSISETKVKGYIEEVTEEHEVVVYQLLDGNGDILETSTLKTNVLPVIPFYGNESIYDGRPLFKGMFSDHKDTQRMFNITRSQLAEAANASPKAKYMVEGGSVDKYQNQWSKLNDGSQTYVEYEVGSSPPMAIQSPSLPTSLIESSSMLTSDLDALQPKEQAGVSSSNAFQAATTTAVDLFTYHFALKFRNGLYNLGLALQGYGSISYPELAEGTIEVTVGINDQTETAKAVYTITELNRTFPQYGEYSAELLLNLLQFKGKDVLMNKMNELKSKPVDNTPPAEDPQASIQQLLAQTEMLKAQNQQADIELRKVELQHNMEMDKLKLANQRELALIKADQDRARLDILQQKQDSTEMLEGIKVANTIKEDFKYELPAA